MADEEPAAKKQKVDDDADAERVQCAVNAAKEAYSRSDMLDRIFGTWDKNGNGVIDFDEVLPYYMKSANHSDLQEQAVRTAFDQFMKAEGRAPQDGITPELFRKWLAPLTETQIAAQYVRHVEGITKKPYGMNLNFAVDKDFWNKSLKEILDSPISAIRGLSDHANDVLQVFGLQTVRELGNWKLFIIARAVCNLAPKEDEDALSEMESPMNIREALTKEHESKTLKHVTQLPVSAFSVCPPSADAVLEKLRIKTIGQLGSRKVFKWANAMAELERYEHRSAV